jgi:uncharacterized membrane protein
VTRRTAALVVVALVLVLGAFVYTRVHRSTFEATCEKSGGRVVVEFTTDGSHEVCVSGAVSPGGTHSASPG